MLVAQSYAKNMGLYSERVEGTQNREVHQARADRQWVPDLQA